MKRLFPNYAELEKDYYRRTKIYPIMHTVVIRNDVYKRDPWVALSMYKALCRAKEYAYHLLADMGYSLSIDDKRSEFFYSNLHLDYNIANTNTFLTELSLFGRLVQDRTNAKPIFYCSFPHWTADAFARKCEDEGTVSLLDPLSKHLDRRFPSSGSRKLEARRHRVVTKVKSGLAWAASKLSR